MDGDEQLSGPLGHFHAVDPVRLKVGDGHDAFGPFTGDGLAMLVRDLAPAGFGAGVLDPLHHGEVVLVLLHRRYPRHAVERDGLDAEVYNSR